MKDIYKGRAIWLGEDSPIEGLVHGKMYILDVKEMASGKIRVDMDSDVYGLKVKHMTFQTRKEFDHYFLLKPKNKKRKKDEEKEGSQPGGRPDIRDRGR